MTPEQKAHEVWGQIVRLNKDAPTSLIATAMREIAHEACDKIITEVEEAACGPHADVVLRHLARDLRFRLDRATADD